MDINDKRIFIGISSCLLGELVRYDGGHRHAPELVQRLERVFDLKPVCPEVAIGMGVPRDPIQLVDTQSGIRVRGVDDNEVDVTSELAQYAQECIQELGMICGYIFKARSPSCGIRDVNVFSDSGQLQNTRGVGLFARSIIAALPDLPVADEDQLQNSDSIDRFIERVHHYYKSRQQ